MSRDVKQFRAELETIESAYEFMLAYAAQGRDTDAGAASGPAIRETLQSMHESLGIVADALTQAGNDETVTALARTLREDAAKAAIAVAAALACSRISSQLVDNLNASIHLRAVLTDLFLADEILAIAAG